MPVVPTLVVFAVLAAATIPDRTTVFEEVQASVAARDYYQASGLLARLMNELLAANVGFAVGAEHEAIVRKGRGNADVAGTVQAAHAAWSKALAGKLPWRAAMDLLAEACASASRQESDLPAGIRYQQARARYSKRPFDSVLLQQVTSAAYEAREWDAALSYIQQERSLAPRWFPYWYGEFLHRRENMAGLIHLEKGEVELAVRCLEAAAGNLLQVKRENHYFTGGLDTHLAQKLLELGFRAEVLRYVNVCIEVRQPPHGMCMNGEPTYETLRRDILEGLREPRFPHY